MHPLSLSKWATAALLSLGLLAACGGGNDSSGNARIRLPNVTTDVEALDLRAAEDVQVSDVATDTISGYVLIDSDTWDLDVTLPDSDTALASGERSLERDTDYTVVVWGESGAVRQSFLAGDEDTDEIDDGKAMVPVLNAATGAGPAGSNSLSGGLTSPSVGAYTYVDAGSKALT